MHQPSHCLLRHSLIKRVMSAIQTFHFSFARSVPAYLVLHWSHSNSSVFSSILDLCDAATCPIFAPHSTGGLKSLHKPSEPTASCRQSGEGGGAPAAPLFPAPSHHCVIAELFSAERCERVAPRTAAERVAVRSGPLGSGSDSASPSGEVLPERLLPSLLSPLSHPSLHTRGIARRPFIAVLL